MIALSAAVLLAYLIGSIPTSYILAKFIKGIDIRNFGSGNVGATNVLRTVGRLPAIIALAVDVLKGAVAVTVLPALLYKYGAVVDYESFCILMGLAAICGHIWTVFLKFKGGKGVATSLGVLAVLSPKVFGIALIVWFIAVLFTRYVSLSSILASISLPISAALMAESLQFVTFCITLCLISSYKHRSNIIRLINSTEPKIK